MGIDTVFKPTGPTALVTNAAPTQSCNPAGGSGVSSFRVVNLAAAPQRLAWGATAANVTNIGTGGPAAAGFSAAVQSVLMDPNGIETFEFPAAAFFQSSLAAGFEMTPGQGA